ncbi:MAG TPA: GyrI-like domain-containing protein [Vicinamibacterales bacterium]|jgi:hypothetical protein
MTPRAAHLEKIDLKKTYSELYRATRKVASVRAARGTYLAIDGAGAPGGDDYQAAIGRLYAMAYTAKFALKGAGLLDFVVPPLECLWFDDPMDTPKDQWRWRLQLRIPDEVTAADIQTVRKALAERRDLDASNVKRVTWTEGRALQVLNVGPYDSVGAAYQTLMVAAAELHLECDRTGHEIYLSDPRKVVPARLKTIVRIAVRAKKR